MTEATGSDTPGISKTAIYVAAGRAVGAREPDPQARNPDFLAEKLLGDPAGLALDHPAVRALDMPYGEAMQDIEVVTNVRMMTVRTRFIDEALEQAIDDGARQVVVLGAGFDTHAYRCENLLAQTRIFEVDRPATQAFKVERVSQALGRPPANLTYVPVDFGRERLGPVLERHGFDASARTFFILEGVTMYLAEEAAHETLRFVAAHRAGSAVVFDYVGRAFVDMLKTIDPANMPAEAKPFVERFLSLIEDEPWQFGIPLGSEADFLGDFALDLRGMLTIGGDESVRRYLTRADGTVVGAEAVAAALARLAARGVAAGAAVPDSGRTAEQRAQVRQRAQAEQRARAEQGLLPHRLAVAVVPSRH
jgi:methyltransferase (TIGR00027 family)